MIKRWVTTFAVLGVLTAPTDERLLEAQPPAAAVPAWVPPPAPAPPLTLWRFLGIPQGFQRIGDARLNRSGNFPGLERKPPLKPIAHPENLLSNNPAIKKAAEIKMQEDLAKQKIKAIKYLAKLGCDKCYGGVKEAMMAALDDCTEQVRYEGAKALGEAAVQHCDVCSRQCCCDEELTKKLAQIVYEMDDKGCPIEPSERVREAARAALEVCCPNVGPPGFTPEVIDPDVTPDLPETPPVRQPETPPSLPPELPPPPGLNGVAPRTNGEVTPRPTLPPDRSTRNFLRSRADRMVATSRVHRNPVVQRAAGQRAVNGAGRMASVPRRPAVEVPRQHGAFAQAPAARLVISDEGARPPVADAAASVTVGDSSDLAQPSTTDAKQSAVRIRISDDGKSSESLAAPAAIPTTSSSTMSLASASSGETVVRIRDSGDELQLASAREITEPDLQGTSVVSSRRSQVMVSDLFAPPMTDERAHGAQPAMKPAGARQPAREVAMSVQSVKPQGAATKVEGRVSDIDYRNGAVRFRYKEGQAPATGALVKVYHQFLLGQECIGALEVVNVRNGVATARPVGNVNLNKVSLDDQVAYQNGAGG